MKDVYFISPKFSNFIGGMETHSYEFAKYFAAEKDYGLKIFINKNVQDGISSEAEVKKIDDSKYVINGFEVNAILNGDLDHDSLNLFDEIKAGSVVFFNSPSWLPVIEKLANKNCKFIVRSGGNDLSAGWIGNENSTKTNLSQSRNYLVSLINNYVDTLICNSRYSEKRAIEIGVNKEKILVLTGGVDCNRFSPIPIKSEPLKIITICRLVSFKGLNYALDAVHKLKEITTVPFTYEIIGSGPLTPDIVKKISEMGLSNLVTLKGPIEIAHIHECYKNASIFLHLPIYEKREEREGTYIHTETMGRNLCEAMACGLAIVASRVGGVPEVVQENINCFLVDEGDFLSAAEKLKILIENSDLRNEFMEKSRALAVEKYCWSKLFSIYKDLFGDIK